LIDYSENLSEIGGQFHFAGFSQRPQKTGVPHEQIQATDGNQPQSKFTTISNIKRKREKINNQTSET